MERPDRFMNEPSIRVERVFKRFRRGESVDSLRDLVARWLPGRPRGLRTATGEFWAVHNVSFQVRPGEALGIIGPNGAGKSTILKLLAGIMPPDRGRVVVNGRVSALIELGAGFHADLTGRENIFLNASILGMSRRDVRRKFDEIVEFAGIGDFLDTPVKRYSSGMYARLGFAIAVHVDPAVLLVDEVLSVGDRVFREKCMNKMREFLRRGVAIVYVSHDLESVQRFCNRAIVLSQGRECFTGSASEAVCRYWDASSDTYLMRGARQRPVAHVSSVRASTSMGAERTTFAPGEKASFEFDVSFEVSMQRPSYGLSLIRLEDHLTVFETSSTRLGVESPPAEPGDRHHVRYDLQLNVAPGMYALGLHVRDRDALVYAADQAYAAKILVTGERTAGGLAHLSPTVQVQAGACEALGEAVLA